MPDTDIGYYKMNIFFYVFVGMILLVGRYAYNQIGEQYPFRHLRLLIIPTLLLGMVSCNINNKPEQTPDQLASGYEQIIAEEPKEVLKDAEQKPKMFYQRLLEQFCQQYYSSCFRGREYHEHSMIVDGTSVIQGHWDNGRIVSYEMKVDGKHSFEGRFANHNDSPFYAFVDDLGDDSYKITFFIKRYGPFGPLDDYEQATRTMTYSEQNE